jgi:hypothetical protein
MFRFISTKIFLILRLGIASGLAFVPATPLPGLLHFADFQSASFVPICEIQGTYFTSPYEGREVRTQGVVYADLEDSSRKGFFLQSENCDGNTRTSDGIFVYLGQSTDLVHPGDQVEVVATVQEYYSFTELITTPESLTVLSSGNPTPVPFELNPPFENKTANQYFESLEGMYVSLPEATVVGPTNVDDATWVVRSDLGIERVFRDDPNGTGEMVCIDDEGIYEINPEVKVGDRIRELSGALDFTAGVYCMLLISRPLVFPAYSIPPEDLPITRPTPGFTIGTYNLANLFDTFDDPLTDDPVLSTSEYQRRLGKHALTIHNRMGEPDFLAVQEAE